MLIKQKFEDLKSTKNNAVEDQKSYMKSFEKYLQNIFGDETYSNFLFKQIKRKEEKSQSSNGFMGWGFIGGWGLSKKVLR